MYFADISSSFNLVIYKNLLDKYLEEKNSDEIRELFENVIKTAHQLASKTIKESSIDNKIYNLVASLSDFNNDFTNKYFLELDPNHIGIDQFRTLSNILSSLIAAENVTN